MEQNKPPRAPLNWTTGYEVSGTNNLVVQVNMTDERRPRYSIKLGRKTADGHIAPFLPVFLDGLKVKSLVAEVTKMLTDEIGRAHV